MAAEDSKRLAINASIVMGATILSRITGFVRETLIPAKYGFSRVTDVYDVAFKFPDLMFNLLIGGAVSAALVPVISGSLSKGEEKEGWESVSRFMNTIMVIMAGVCIAGSIFSKELVTMLADGWNPDNPEHLEMILVASRLTRVLFPSVAFLMLAAFSNSVLYSYQRFASAALGPTLYNVLCILSIMFLSNQNPDDYYGVDRVVYGVMFSSLAYFLFQLRFAFKNIKDNFVFKLGLFHKGFQRVFKLAVPSMISSSVIQINTMVTARFASRFAEGSIAAVRSADRTWQMPLGIIAQSMGVALLPSLSGKIANGDKEGYKKSLAQGVRSVLLLTIPCAAAFIVLNKMIMRTLFQNSMRVTEGDIGLTAIVLVFYSTSLITQSFNTILTRAFYACNETKLPMMTGVGIIILNIVLSVAFYNLTPIGVGGMALAYSVSSFVNTVLLVKLLTKRFSGLRLTEGMAKFIGSVVIASVVMSAALICYSALVPASFIVGGFSIGLKLRQFLTLGVAVCLGAGVYFLVISRMKIEEVALIAGMVKSRFKRFKRK